MRYEGGMESHPKQTGAWQECHGGGQRTGMPWRRTKNRNAMEEHARMWRVMEQEYDRGVTKQECHGACCGVQRRDTEGHKTRIPWRGHRVMQTELLMQQGHKEGLLFRVANLTTLENT